MVYTLKLIIRHGINKMLKYILLGAFIGFLVSAYFLNSMTVCCNTAPEATNGYHCTVCTSIRPENTSTLYSQSLVPFIDNNNPNTSYLRIFDDVVFQYIENICPWSICFDGPCVPINLKVTIFDIEKQVLKNKETINYLAEES